MPTSDIGDFIAVLEFTDESYNDKRICVAPDDIIFVDFIPKGASATATFTK